MGRADRNQQTTKLLQLAKPLPEGLWSSSLQASMPERLDAVTRLFAKILGDPYPQDRVRPPMEEIPIIISTREQDAPLNSRLL